MLRNFRNFRNIFSLRGVINSDTPKRVSRFVTPLQGVSRLEPDTCSRYVVVKLSKQQKKSGEKNVAQHSQHSQHFQIEGCH